LEISRPALPHLVFRGWAATDYFEPKAGIVSPQIYWWYFLNDVMRGGYSGYARSRSADASRRLPASSAEEYSSSRPSVSQGRHKRKTSKEKKGLVKLNIKDHVVLLGYRERETKDLIEQLRADHLMEVPIVLVTRHADENPLPGDVEFVHGDTAEDDTLERACIPQAKVIVISGHQSDERTLVVAIAANSQARRDVHMVAYLEKHENSRFLKMLNPRIECVTSLRSRLIAQQSSIRDRVRSSANWLVSTIQEQVSGLIYPKERRRSDSASSWPSSIRNIAPSPLVYQGSFL